MERISEQEKWFFPEEQFFTAKENGEEIKPLAISAKEDIHYPSVSRAEWFPCKCDLCGQRNVTRRCLRCDPIADAPEELDEPEDDEISPEEEQAWNARIAKLTDGYRRKQDREGAARKKKSPKR